MSEQRTSIGFGNREVVIVSIPLVEFTETLQRALSTGRLLTLVDQLGDEVVINPTQVKILQPLNAGSRS